MRDGTRTCLVHDAMDARVAENIPWKQKTGGGGKSAYSDSRTLIDQLAHHPPDLKMLAPWDWFGADDRWGR